MKVLFLTNLPSPYRVDFFNEFGKTCDLVVCYERQTANNRDKKWKSADAVYYHEVFLSLHPLGDESTYGSAIRRYISSQRFDILIINDYTSPACMEAIFYCKLKRIPYIIEFDGGFNKPDSCLKRILKQFLLCSAKAHLTTSDEHIAYLTDLGISANHIYKYPFTSVFQKEVLKNPLIEVEKVALRQKLGITEKNVIISVGRYSYQGGKGKGFDLLFQTAEQLPPEFGIYIIADEPTSFFINWKREKSLSHIHFIPFMVKQDLFEYYRAADLFVLLTREDIWGLVINEAIANGLPVITTDKCIAGTELIEQGINGWIIPSNTFKKAIVYIMDYCSDPVHKKTMPLKCLETAERYTIEEMVKRHLEVITNKE